MSKIDGLKAEIERLPSEEFRRALLMALGEGAGEWDRQIKRDSQAGRLDFVIHEVRQEKSEGELKDL